MFLLLLAACESTEVEPDGMRVRVQLQASSDTNALGSWTISEAYLKVQEVKFEGEKEDDNEVEYELTRRTTINLITGEANPSLAPLIIPAGTYEEFEVKVQSVDDGSTSLFLKGVLQNDTQQLPVEIDIREAFSLELEWEPYTVEEGTTFGAVFQLDPMPWFQALDVLALAQAQLTADGVLVISPESNAALYTEVVANLSQGVSWEWDD